MIDWNNKDSLRRRGDNGVRAEDVNITPEWISFSFEYLHHVKWSDGKICGYLPNGRYLSTRKHELDVIPAPRSGEGWLSPLKSEGQNRTLYDEQQNVNQIKIRWEEVSDDGNRSGEGWINHSSIEGQSLTLYAEQKNADQIKIRWEEVSDDGTCA